METINNLIFQTLIQRKGINLPNIGSLSVQREGAYLRKKNLLIPTIHRVVFSSNMQPEWSYIEQVAQNTKEIDPSQFEQFYKDWSEGCRTENGFTITGVGTIRNNHFTPSPELNNLLNPEGMGPITLPRRNFPWSLLLWGLAAFVIGGGITWGVLDFMAKQNAVPSVVEQVVVETPAPEAQPTLDSITSIPATPLTPATPSASTLPVPSTPKTLAAGEVLYHVVGGVFSNESNADKFITKLDKAGITGTKLPYGSGTMVSIYSSPDEATATVQMRKLRSVESEVWVYKQRSR